MLLFDLLFSSLLQLWYFKVWISPSVSKCPLEFEITRVNCMRSHKCDLRREGQTNPKQYALPTFEVVESTVRKVSKVGPTEGRTDKPKAIHLPNFRSCGIEWNKKQNSYILPTQILSCHQLSVLLCGIAILWMHKFITNFIQFIHQ